MSRVYLSPPDVGEEERAALLDAFDSGWIAPVGPHIGAFETALAERVGVPDVVAVSSGTAALHLALVLSGVGPGDDVLVPTFTFVATANTVRYTGARPVFVDCSRHTWQIDPDLVADELDRRQRAGRLPAAVVSVDLYGQSADYDRLQASCAQHGVALLEDAAEALGATYGGRAAGSFGEAAVLSFNGNKIITTSSGGALLSRSTELTSRARHLATQAREAEVHYQHIDLGYNYRMSNLLAALGLAQVRGLDGRLSRRRRVHERYRQALGDIAGIEFMPVAPYGEPNHWLTCILVDPDEMGRSRDDLQRSLETLDIEARPTWKPLHLQPLYAEAEVIGGSVAEDIFRHGLCLPSGSNLSEADQDRVTAELSRAPDAAGAEHS